MAFRRLFGFSKSFLSCTPPHPPMHPSSSVIASHAYPLLLLNMTLHPPAPGNSAGSRILESFTEGIVHRKASPLESLIIDHEDGVSPSPVLAYKIPALPTLAGYPAEVLPNGSNN